MRKINRPITFAVCKEQIINVFVEIKKQQQQPETKIPKEKSSFRNTQKGEMHGGSHLVQLLAV